MTQELETYFNNYFAMFRSEGWKQLISELNGNAGQINSVELTTDNDNLNFRKGQLAILATILNLETQITSGFEHAQEEQEDSQQELGFDEAV